MMAIHRILIPVLLVLTCFPLVSPALSSGNLPVAFSSKIAGDEKTTRFFVNFDKSLRLKTFYMDEPYRIIIDLEEVAFEFADDTGPVPRGLVSDVKYGRISDGRSRIVLTLNGPAEITNASLKQPLDEDFHRFVLDFDTIDSPAFARLLDNQAREIGESGGVAKRGDRVKPAPAAKPAGGFTVVLDPGHGGIDGGATGRDGTLEKEVVLAVALRLADEIRALGPYQVLLTRSDDQFVSLRERVSFSRRNKADLFISIHADSLRQRSVRGATVYTLAKRASDRLAAQLAESENAADLVAGLSVESDADAVGDILADLTTRETKRFSKMFSGILVQNLKEVVQLIKNPQRSAAFVVLKAPDVPGVLLELGYLSNRKDEELLRRPEWQARVAETVATAVKGFFSLRNPE